MSMSTEDKIRHYQRSIDRSLQNKPRLLHCIEMLSKLPVTVNHLQITGVGRTVNALRKIEEGVGDAAKVLVNKWKEMVANHVDSTDEEDEACVPDVPECYESPDCDSEPENEINQRENNTNQNRPEALKSVISISPPLVVDTDNVSDTLPSSSNDHKENLSDDEPENLPNKSSSSRQSSSSLDHSSSKSKHSKKDSESKSLHKDKSSNSHSSHSKNSHNVVVSDHKKRNKNKSESSNKDKKHPDNRKRKYESSSSDRESDKKKNRVSESEEEEQEEERDVEEEEIVSVQDERSEEEVVEDEEDSTDTAKEKSKDKHGSSSSKHSKSKSHESRDKSKKDKKSSKSDGRGKEENNKSEEHRSKESSKSKSCHSSSSSKDHSKDRDKDKHSKDKNKESSSKSHKDEKDRSSKKEIKDDKGKSKEQEKKDKERKESKHNKEHKEDKEHKEHKEKKKPKLTDGGIDCNSGTSFADALGMCTIPPPKKKKESSSKSSKDSPSLNLSSSSSSSTSISKSINSKSSVKGKSNPPESAESLSLLSSNVKLDPLNRLDEEVDLALTLPEPSPYYKPLPHINHAQRRQDEDQMLSQVIYAKNQRTKVYSGNKTGNTSVPSLYEMCIRILIENIDALEFTGGVPYFIIKPILERATADQLFMLEHHNPYLIEDSDPLWQFHCNKDFRTHKREEMESWREMYMRCLDEREAKLKALTANIKQSIDKSQPLRSTKLAYVDNIVKPPRSVLRKQAKYGTANSSTSASDLKRKLITGVTGNSGTSNNSNSNSSTERISVPPPPIARSRPPSSSVVKKTKAPLMAKALQAIKGRYKR